MPLARTVSLPRRRSADDSSYAARGPPINQVAIGSRRGRDKGNTSPRCNPLASTNKARNASTHARDRMDQRRGWHGRARGGSVPVRHLRGHAYAIM